MPVFAPAVALEQFSTFGDLLKYLRRRAGLTQRELSIAVGYSDTQISRLELNQRPPDLATIAALFIPALGLEHEPETAARLLALASVMQRADAPASGLPPFKGLHYFDEADADLFFGREVLVAQLLECLVSGLPAQRFLGIVGASGSGKSSILRAGLVPAVRWGQTSIQWQIHTLTPTAHPLSALAACLTQAADANRAAARRGPHAAATFADELARDPLALHGFVHRRVDQVNSAPAASQVSMPGHVLLVVDQFEELFTLCREEDQRRAFIDNLMNAALAPNGPTCVVLTLRADFYPNCAPYAALRDALAARQAYIGPMCADELKRAIEEPARCGGWDLETGLVAVLLKDLGADGAQAPEPGALPLLSHALLETWKRRRGRTLTVSGYLASGGVRGAIAETAEAVFQDELDAQQRAIARTIFLRLTEIGDSAVVAETRRRATFEELISQPEDAPAVRDVLTKLADARLITMDQGEVQVAHEALIREWPTLRGWLDENRDELRLHRHVTLAAEGWVRQRRDPAELYRGARLAQALEWAAAHPAELNALEAEFLAASRQLAEREAVEREAQRQRELDAARQLAQAEQRRAEQQARAAAQLRRRAVSLVGVVALAMIAALVAGVYASRNAALAQGNALLAGEFASIASTAQAMRGQAIADVRRSQAERLAAQAISLMQSGGDPQLIALLSLRSIGLQYTPLGDTALAQAGTLPLPMQILAGPTNPVLSAVFSPDGRYVLAGGQPATVWEAHTGRQVRQLAGQGGAWRAAFSPDGRFILTGGLDGTVRLWDVETGEALRDFTGHTEAILVVAFSPDGLQVLTGSADRTARLWDVQTGEVLREFAGHAGHLQAAAFSPDGLYVVTGSTDQTARLWQVATGDEVLVLGGHTDEVTSVAFSPDGGHIVTASRDKTGRVWDAASGQELGQLIGHAEGVTSVAYSPDGQWLLTGSSDKTARLWNAQTGRQLHLLWGQHEVIAAVGFSLDGRYLLTGSRDASVWLWDAQRWGGELPPLVGHAGAVLGIAVSADRQLAVTGGADATARLWDHTGRELHTLVGHEGPVTAVALASDGRSVLTGGADGTARLWDVQTGQILQRFTGHSAGLSVVAYAPDQQHILTGSWDGAARRWEAQTGRLLTTYAAGARINGAAFSPDGQFVLTGSNDHLVRLWDAETGVAVRQFVGHTDAVNAVAASFDGRLVVSGSDDQTARLWDIETGQELLRLTGHTAPVWGVALAPFSNYVTTAGADNTLRAWYPTTGQEARRWTAHFDRLILGWTSGSSLIGVTANEAGVVRLWNPNYFGTVRYLCARLLRDLTDEERSQYEIGDPAPTCPQASTP